MFAAGSHVEVSGDRENYGAAWFPGTIVKVIKETKFLVEYWTLKEDGDCELSREIVSARYIRPLPPCMLEAKQFELLSDVEAFNHCGWMVGVVTKILDDSKYIVKLKYRKEKELEFHHSDLRISRDWICGRWCHASRDKCIKEAGPSCENKVDSSQLCKKRKGDPSDHLPIELGPTTPILVTKVDAAMPNFENPSSDFITASPCIATRLLPNLSFGELSHGQPSAEFNGKSELLSRGEESCNFKLEGSEQPSKAPSFDHSPLTIEWGKCKGIRSPRGNALRQRKKLDVCSPRRQREVCFSPADIVDVRKHSNEGMKKRSGKPPKKSIIHLYASAKCMEVQQPERTTDLVIDRQQRRDGADLSSGGVVDDVANVIPQMCLRYEATGCEHSPRVSDIKGVSPNSDIINIQADKHVDAVAASSSTPQTESSAGGDASVKYSTARPLSNVMSSPFNTRVQEMLNIGNGLSDIGTEARNQVPLPPFKEGSAVAISNSFNTRDQQVSSFCNRLNASGKEAGEMTLLSSLKEGSALTHKDRTPSGSPSQGVSIEERVSIDPSPRGSSSTKTILPFVKRSFLWESIESMEVFRIMRQQPHFRQLEMYSMEFREGMAIGLMVSFTNLVASMRELHISDSRMAFEEIMKALIHLEANGFDVQCIRSCMDELLEIRYNRRQLQDKKATLKQQFFERASEKDRLDVLNVVFEKFIMELEQHFARNVEERDSIVMQRKNNESDIARLDKDVQAVEEACLSAKKQFDTALVSRW